jgi:hypothetical protein
MSKWKYIEIPEDLSQNQSQRKSEADRGGRDSNRRKEEIEP